MYTFTLILWLIAISTAQQCMQSPPAVTHNKSAANDVLWLEIAENVYSTNLSFGVYHHTYSPINHLDFTSFTSRAFNQSIPGPTLRMKRGMQYIINFSNELGPEASSNPSRSNVIKDLNTTNIHLHGVHISGEGESDNIFDIVGPSAFKRYHYYLPCDHSGGTFWYHSHHHGSTAVQVGGGAAGALIIEDSPQQENMPSYYSEMKEYVLVVQGFDLQYIQDLGKNEPDLLFWYDSHSGPNSFILINGLFQPTICVQENEWTKLRIVHVDNKNDLDLYFVPSDEKTGQCVTYLFAKDGVLLHGLNNETPRKVESAFFTPSSRADIAINCEYVSAGYLYQIKSGGGSGDIIGYIKVIKSEAGSAKATPSIYPFSPNRPKYLQSLLNYTGPMQQYNDTGSFFKVSMGATTINSQEFNGPATVPMAYLQSGLVNEWSINGASSHPTHAHINHFQIYSGGDTGPDNWTVTGDWIDTLQSNGVVRFHANRWGGTVILHCHILEHEDKGSMAVVYINGGCNWNLTSFYDENGRVIEPACNASCYAPWNQP